MLNNRNDVENLEDINVLLFGKYSNAIRYIDKLLFKIPGHTITIKEISGQKYINDHTLTLSGSSTGVCGTTENFYDLQSYDIPLHINVILFVEGSKEEKEHLIQQSIQKNCLFVEYDENTMTPESYVDSILCYKNNKELISTLDHKIILLFAIHEAKNIFPLDIMRIIANMLIPVTFNDKPNKLVLFSLFKSEENKDNKIDINERSMTEKFRNFFIG